MQMFLKEYDDKVFQAHQLNDLSLDLMHSGAYMAMWQPVHAECSQKGFYCGEKDDSWVLVTL